MSDRLELLEKKLAREKKARRMLEDEIEEKTSRLFVAFEYQQSVFNALQTGIMISSVSGEIKSVNEATKKFFSKIDFNSTQNIIDVLQLKRVKGEHFASDSSLWHNTEFEFSASNKTYLIDIGEINVKESEFIFNIKDITNHKKRENQIRALQEQIAESAYRDGVAENAVSILHNIGNVLTTIINKPSKAQALSQLAISNSIIDKLVDNLSEFKSNQEFADFIVNDVRGKQLIPLLKQLSENYKEIENFITQYAKFTEDRCFHIGSIITTQQKFANYKKKTIEDVNLLDLISDCLKMHQDKAEKRQVRIETHIDPNDVVKIEKIGLLQVISNIILNAIESMDERIHKDPFYKDKILSIESSQVGQYTILTFKDNGMGIEDKTIKNLFKYGFSTKNRGSGFGLHNCANFMKKSKGDIEITSEGPNQGATIKLFCPTADHSNE